MKLSCFEVNFVDLTDQFFCHEILMSLLGRVVWLMWLKSFHYI